MDENRIPFQSLHLPPFTQMNRLDGCGNPTGEAVLTGPVTIDFSPRQPGWRGVRSRMRRRLAAWKCRRNTARFKRQHPNGVEFEFTICDPADDMRRMFGIDWDDGPGHTGETPWSPDE